MDVLREYGACIRRWIPRLVLIALLSIVAGLIYANKPASPKLPVVQDSMVPIEVKYVLMPRGEFQAVDEFRESMYFGSFQECFVISEIVHEGNYSVSPFFGYDVTKLKDLHVLTVFPLFNVPQAEALSKEFGYAIETDENGDTTITAKVRVSKEIFDKFHEDYTSFKQTGVGI